MGTRTFNLILQGPPVYTPFLTGSSSNGRYTVDQQGKPFLVNADTLWSIVSQLNSTNQTTVLADRQTNGFNTILTDLVGSLSMTGRGNGSNWNGETPGTFGTGTFNPNNTYWSRVDTFFNLCATYGISVFALPVDAYAAQDGSTWISGATNAQYQALGTFLGNRYPTSQYPALAVWMMGNDYSGGGAGGTNNNNNNMNGSYEAMMTGIQSTGDARPVTTEFSAPDTCTSDTTDSTFLALNTLNWGYTYVPTYENCLRGYSANKGPFIFGEGAYENSTVTGANNPLDIRKVALWPMTCGASGCFYGNDSLWQFPNTTGGSNSIPSGQLDTADVASRKAYMAAIGNIAWWKLAPDTSSLLVTGGRGTQLSGRQLTQTYFTNDTTYGHYVTASYSADGTIALVYNPDSSVNTAVTLSSSVLGPSPSITKVDPTNGATTNLGWTTTPSGGANAGGDHDWLYIITAN